MSSAGELAQELNVFGEPLQPCSTDPMSGFFRNGSCMVGPDEVARHLVCCEVTDAFLAFSMSVGNDLTTPMPQYAFPGLKAGDRWCLHVLRWKEALEAGKAPRIAVLSTLVEPRGRGWKHAIGYPARSSGSARSLRNR